ncbi:response regulator [Parvibaculaceae bacterium PLY_AMNH_Bact1]|nr:response regulator [Parvibaculaceae bacterium PLY_AMNH_Bact1]
MVDAVGKPSANDASASDIEALFSEAIEALDDGFAIYDSEFRVLYANAQARTDFKDWYGVIEAGGTFKDAMLASLVSITKYSEDDGLEELAEAAVNMLLEGEPLKTAMPDGRTLLITHRPMTGERWVGTSIDMTDELVRQQELKEMKKEAEAASRAKSQFLANMSHEIRTPLNAVLGFASLIKDTELNERQSDYVETIVESGESLLAILNDVLDVSKIEAGALDLDETEVNIERLIRSVMALMSVRAQSKDLEIASYVDPNIPVSLVGDQGRIRQILVNLIGNAIKFTEEGGISLEVRLEDRLPGDKVAILFSVSDTGMGISAEQQAQLFERFTQADVSTTREFGGTGLGLSICHDLVELMEGTLEVQSEVGKGSTFRARIVLEADDGDERYLDSEDAQTLRGRRLLVVDDNQVNLRVIGLMLAAYGCRVETIDNPMGARDAILAAQEKGKPFETIIIDHMMPGMDGVQLAAQLQEDDDVKPVKLILSSSGIATASQAEEWGFDAIAPKPISQRRLINTLNRFFESMPTKAKAEATAPKKVKKKAPRPKRPSGDGAGCRILLADDNPTNLKFIQSALEKHPVTVDTVGDGREAVSAARSLPYDLVLMDVQMIHMDGIEATKRIRKLGGEIASVPIIAITASAMAGDRERCIDAGMNDYLAKPVAIDQLLDKIRYWTEEAVREA